jgi:hypothetical protein
MLSLFLFGNGCTESGIIGAYHAGLISKDAAAMALAEAENRENKKPMDTYGKVVDQDGQPVADAKVCGFLGFVYGSEEHDTTTDAQGNFHFSRLRGTGFGIFPEKEGYEFNREIWFAANAERPDNYLPDPKNPWIIHMWKLRGGEPMNHALTYSFVPWDGNFKQFDLYKSQMDEAWNHHPLGTNGELMVRVTRGIAFTNNGIQEFNWTATLEITNGGLLAFNDPYPYIAPSEGYQTSVTLDGPTNFVDWGNGLRQGYYFKSKGGQVYGRMIIRMGAGKNYASFDAEIYANPNNSRNLEFDYSKEIRVQH